MRPYLSLFFFITLLFFVVWSPSFICADNWQAPVYEYGAPARLVGVDKKKRVFKYFEKQSPFRLRYSYPCVTGQLPGDKQQINDLRTPEGIYFVEYKIAGGLDFKEYGGIAYTLNYPNPVDRLRGKTGHGIWIHSKGFELVPTRGCVAIGLNNIAEVGPHLLPGTAVILAEQLSEVARDDNGTLATLRELMGRWSNAWASKSPEMFDFYDPDAYTRATENFELFRQNKERLFKILSFIKIYNREIHAMEGPGYWVTWAEQFYTASNLSTEGIRRLYWQKSRDGKFRIVGMEWTPRDMGMAADFRKGTLVAEAAPALSTDAALEAPVAPRLDMPELAPEVSVPATGKTAPAPSVASITPISTAASADQPPKPVVEQKKDEFDWGQGKRLNETPAPRPSRATPALQLPATPVQPAAEAKHTSKDFQTEVMRLTNDWLSALQNRDSGIESFYDAKFYNRLPASSGVPRGQSLAAILQGIRRDYRQPWIVITNRVPTVKISDSIAHAKMDMLIATPRGMRQGEQNLWWKRDGDNLRIVGSSFKPAALGLEANYLEQVSGDIAATVEEWRKAWEAGDLDNYMTFYSENAMQQGKVGANNIRRQKESLWHKARPSLVQLSGLRVTLDGTGARADMTQSYSDSSGRGDKGVKTLFLRFDGRNWLIQREDWANLVPDTRRSPEHL